MRKPKYKRWPYGREWDEPKPKYEDFEETMNAIASMMTGCLVEFRQLQKMRKLGSEAAYLRALEGNFNLRFAFHRWVNEAKTINPNYQPPPEPPAQLKERAGEQSQG